MSDNQNQFHKNRHAKKQWAESDVQRLRQLRDVEKMEFPDIGRELGRTEKSCHAKYWALQNYQVIHGQPEPGTRVSVTPEQIADRDERYQAWLRQSPAAALMGEPLPGRSALDLRRQGGAQ